MADNKMYGFHFSTEVNRYSQSDRLYGSAMVAVCEICQKEDNTFSANEIFHVTFSTREYDNNPGSDDVRFNAEKTYFKPYDKADQSVHGQWVKWYGENVQISNNGIEDFSEKAKLYAAVMAKADKAKKKFHLGYRYTSGLECLMHCLLESGVKHIYRTRNNYYTYYELIPCVDEGGHPTLSRTDTYL
jgi:hypothetical protein